MMLVIVEPIYAFAIGRQEFLGCIGGKPAGTCLFGPQRSERQILHVIGDVAEIGKDGSFAREIIERRRH